MASAGGGSASAYGNAGSFVRWDSARTDCLTQQPPLAPLYCGHCQTRDSSLSIISIFDPLFTLPLIALVAAGVLKRDGRYGRAALIWSALYLSAAGYQHLQAYRMATTLAESRGHEDVRLVVKPTFGNIFLWRSIYAVDGRFYVDGVLPWPRRRFFEGTSIATLKLTRDFPWLQPGSRQARDITRFARLSDGFVAKALDGSPLVIDVRYSFLPTETAPLWFIV